MMSSWLSFTDFVDLGRDKNDGCSGFKKRSGGVFGE